MTINKINLDGTEYEVGGQEYTAGDGIKIENGVISALGGTGAGGGSKLYKHTYKIFFSTGPRSFNAKKVDFSSNATPMTQADFVAWVNAELIKTKFKHNNVTLESDGSGVFPLIISNSYYGENINLTVARYATSNLDDYEGAYDAGYCLVEEIILDTTTIEGLDCSEELNNLIKTFEVTTEEV
jgi:hypothetical protein